MVVTGDYNPSVSSNTLTKKLIREKQTRSKACSSFYEFCENLTILKDNPDVDLTTLSTEHGVDLNITFNDLYDKYIALLQQYIKVVDSNNQNELKDFLDAKLATIEEEKKAHTSVFDINSLVTEKSELFYELYDSFDKYLNKYETYISAPLTIHGISNRINSTFRNAKLLTTLEQVGVKINPNFDIKHAPNGRNAIHVDGQTDFSTFEIQFETYTQFIKDMKRKTKCTCFNIW